MRRGLLTFPLTSGGVLSDVAREADEHERRRGRKIEIFYDVNDDTLSGRGESREMLRERSREDSAIHGEGKATQPETIGDGTE